MINKIKTLILSLSFMATMIVPAALTPALTYAATPATTPTVQENICKGAKDLQISSTNANGEECKTDAAGNESSVNKFLQKAINIFSVVVGIVAVLMIIYAGFRYITSGGASDKVTSAKNTILYALIGLVIVALAQLIVKFVLNNASTIQ